jgi:hypothetical protein
MAMTNAEAMIIAPVLVAAGGTEAAPPANGTGAVVGPFVDYADTFSVRITNGTSAPVTTSMTVKVYGSAVNTGRWTEIAVIGGDLVASSAYSFAVPCPPGFSYFTAKAFGAGTNGATVEVYLERQVP